MALTKGIVSGGNYTFSAANQTITFSSDYIGMSLSDVTYITNIKSGVATVIYDPFDATKGGVLNGLVLTLAYNTTSMGNTDPLQIIVGFTPNTATPASVAMVENAQLEAQTELLSGVAENIDLLAKTVDRAEGIEVNIRDVNPAKRDVNNAQVLSDAISTNVVPLSVTGRTNLIVDTQGYSTIILEAFGLSSTSAVLEQSTDLATWVEHTYSSAAITNPSANLNGTGTFILNAPVQLRYSRVRIVAGTNITVRFTLRIANLQLLDPNSGTFTKANIALVNGGTPLLSAGTSVNTGLGTTSVGISTGGGFVPTQNAPNTNTTLSTSVPYPIGIGGREQPYIGALSGIFRYITVDGGGRYILGGDTPDTETRTQSKRGDGAVPGIPPRGVGARSNTMMGGQALNVQDVSQSEGDTTTTLLQQILVELKMLNQQINELPLTMNLGIKMQNEVGEYRQEEYNNHVNNQ